MSRDTDDPTTWSAGEIAEKIASGAVSAAEVTEACIRRINQVNPSLNAMVVPLFDRARVDAAAVDRARSRGESLGPLAGVPLTVKESFDVAGTPSTLGLSSRARHRAANDDCHVARLRSSGAILLGKTNVPQLLMGNESDNPVYGRTNNPWNTERAAGGSSGGEAALVAAGGSALGLGSDIGGSVRLPAHACGIHAIKPTSGRLTMASDAPVFPGQEAIVVQPGVMARHVGDLRLGLQCLCAPDQIFVAELPSSSPPRVDQMRIAFYTDNGVISVAPAIARAVREVAAALANCGARVEEWQPPEAAEAWTAYLGIMLADGCAGARRMAEGSRLQPRLRHMFLCGRFPRWLLAGVASPVLRMLGQRNLARDIGAMGHVSAEEYCRLVQWRADYRQRFLDSLSRGGFDAIVCPPDALPALLHGGSEFLASALSYPAIYNLLGMPAGAVAVTTVRPDEETRRAAGGDRVERMAIECERNSAGLPVGVQVAARHWREDIVLNVMGVIEDQFSGSPGYPRRPPI